jgi:hypothetical protein
MWRSRFRDGHLRLNFRALPPPVELGTVWHPGMGDCQQEARCFAFVDAPVYGFCDMKYRGR